MAGGRPTKYDPKFCEIAIEVMGRGFSKTALARLARQVDAGALTGSVSL